MSAAKQYEDDEITKEEAMAILKIKSWDAMKNLMKKHSISFRRMPKYYFSRKEILEVRESLKQVL
ncbi:MAG: hypothetical protein CL674_14595 [Bdellovibrionaceae bacterium]|jgi:hypothetical protein|nr:hypothetical protein [Pseudobdellovibrionaceae bacterium]MAF92496.1 hypothetical protein [Pseudobdellovibrionaceae bacterium]QDP47588.1 MAG: hypothetical protein GOVbin1174_36 [Prokaryotic dsDNA virus sp.]|tara:strand:+ start:31931 stop:32125 length:195 start_codon:yes stop_codon:yes gene_type:complete